MKKKTIFTKPGEVEYQMPKKMADDLLKASGKKKGQFDTQEYLVDYVNRECGLLRHCIKVNVI